MIKGSELRIGSYILVDEKVKEVCCIKADEGDPQTGCFIGFQNNNSCEYEPASSERLSAVPLSGEILTKLGFTFHDYFKRWQHRKPDRTTTLELRSDFSVVDFSNYQIMKNITYLHLLQNLFFSIQKVELRFAS